MKCAPFEYVRAGSVEEAVATLGQAGDEGKVLAGGQSLVPVLALRLARPSVLVDVNRVPGLDGLTPDGEAVRVGALVRHAALAMQPHHPLLAEAARWIGHAAIRTRGTFGGSLAHADPSAELPVVAVATGATVHLSGRQGSRSLDAEDLFDGALVTTLADDELITAADVPVPDRWGFAEFARRHGDFALVTAHPSACTPNIRQARTGSPSTRTVHAPQTPCSQPRCVPVSPRSSRSRSARVRRGSISASTGSPFTVKLTIIRLLPARDARGFASSQPATALCGSHSARGGW